MPHHPFAWALTAALLSNAVSPAMTAAQDPPTRPPAPTLSRPDSPTKSVGADGFFQRWLVLEPIATTGRLTDSAVQATVKTEYFPSQFSGVPRDGETVAASGMDLRWHAIDTTRYNVNLYHFAYALNRPTSNVLFWAVTVVHAPRDLTNVRLAIGSNAASVWWVNGEEVIGLYQDRQTVIDDGVSNRLTLRQGPNVIRAAIINAGGATDFCARLLDADDQPITDLAVGLDGGGLARP